MAELNLQADVPPGLHLISAFLAMEPTDCLISLARECGGGLVTERVQRFVWDHCLGEEAFGGQGYAPYLKNFVKKLISEVELRHGTMLDELYELYGYYMTTKEDGMVKGNVARVCKRVSFLFPDGKLVVPLHCSLNMLEGDTGCSIWPSSLYMSEVILSFPEIFSSKSCFEVGSGTGLVGICLSHVKTAKVILSDGDLSTLANMKLNLSLNQLSTGINAPEKSSDHLNVTEGEMDNKSVVKCIHLPWESATEIELQEFVPDIVLGADIIYDPLCHPHLVRLLAILLNKMRNHSLASRQSWQGPLPGNGCDVHEDNSSNEGEVPHSCNLDKSETNPDQDGCRLYLSRAEKLHTGSSNARWKKGPRAYIASVIRNIETFNYFLELADQANLIVTEITETLRPFDLLPYMRSYDRSSIHLYTVTCK